MKIALCGYGKMGKLLEEIALENGHSIVAKIDSNNDRIQLEKELQQADVAIDFSTPQTVVQNILHCFDFNIPVVVGTTGWNSEKNKVVAHCKQHRQALFVASNFSIGVNLFFELNKKLAQIMNAYPDYRVRIEETHHLQKIDKPSGTAISLAEDLIANNPEKKSWICEEPNLNSNAFIPIKASREGDVFGIHQVFYESDEDFIAIRHHAKSRRGFAKGALLAAEWLIGKKGFFTMSDLLYPKTDFDKHLTQS